MKHTPLLFPLLSAMALAGCSSVDSETSPQPGDIRLNHPSKKFNQAVQTNQTDFIQSMNEFAKDFLQIAYKNDENVVFSPLSIATAFAMLREGTNGNSKTQLDGMLHVQDTYTLSEQMQTMLLHEAIDDEETGTYLDIAESFFAVESFRDEMKDAFVDTLTRDYYAEAFCGNLSSQQMHQALADWINGKTKNFLSVTAEDFKDLAGVLWLVNSVYLKTKWASDAEFEYDASFTNLDGTRVDAHYFGLEYIGAYYAGDGYGIGSVSLKNGLYMNFLLPDIDQNAAGLLANPSCYAPLLSANPKHRPVDGLRATDSSLQIRIPTFDSRLKYDLKQYLPSLGVTDIFNPDYADLSGIADSVPGEELYVENAIHEARVNVSPSGVEAGAYTIFEDIVSMDINRPFLYSIMDEQGLPLFVGAVNAL